MSQTDDIEQGEEDAPPVEVRGVTETDYAQWRRQPVSQVFLQFLRDYAADIDAFHMAAWKGGELESVADAEMAGCTNTCTQMAKMPFEAIAEFYKRKAEEAAAAEAAEIEVEDDDATEIDSY